MTTTKMTEHEWFAALPKIMEVIRDRQDPEMPVLEIQASTKRRRIRVWVRVEGIRTYFDLTFDGEE